MERISGDIVEHGSSIHLNVTEAERILASPDESFISKLFARLKRMFSSDKEGLDAAKKLKTMDTSSDTGITKSGARNVDHLLTESTKWLKNSVEEGDYIRVTEGHGPDSTTKWYQKTGEGKLEGPYDYAPEDKEAGDDGDTIHMDDLHDMGFDTFKPPVGMR